MTDLQERLELVERMVEIIVDSYIAIGDLPEEIERELFDVRRRLKLLKEGY